MELLGKSKDELRDLCQSLGEPAYRGGQIYHALYAERKFDVQQMTNLPAAFRQRLAAEAQITLPTVRQRYVSQDGSMRYLFALHDAENEENADAACEEAKGTAKNRRPAAVEAVFMPSDGRQTICISTQAGCAVDCQFCLTAQLGLIRNLTPAEILAQMLIPLEQHKSQLAPQTNLVLMGQGEPLLNFDAVMAALRIIHKYPLAALLEACRNYPLRPWEQLTFEYVMLGGVNDAPEDARRVVRLLANLKSVKVNLIPWNPGELPYRESSAESIEEFRKILVDRGIPAFVRYSRGRDVMAACGQLALLNIAPTNVNSAP